MISNLLIFRLEIGLEPDLFLLQCCAALAPPELFVKRIIERFGLANYTSLILADHNEYVSDLSLSLMVLCASGIFFHFL